MKKSGIIGIAIIVVAVLLFGTVWSTRSKAIKLRNQIDAQYTANKSNYDTMWKTFQENAQVTELQADQFKDVYNDLFKGRADSGQLINAVKEQNPSMNTEVYTKLQDTITSSRKVFDKNQKTISDMIGNYNSYIQTNFITQFMSFETLNADDFVVLSAKTNNAFVTGEDDAINLKSK